MSTRARDTLAPLPRTWLDTTMPLLRAVVGAAFVAFSSYATVFLFAEDIYSIVGERMQVAPFQDRYWYGIILAIGFFVGEIYTSERWTRAYRAVLVPDTIYTARQMYPGFLAAFTVLIVDMPSLVLTVALIGGGVVLVSYGAGWPLRLWIPTWAVAGNVVWFVGWAWSLPNARLLLAILLALYCGYIVARFGEVFLFGKRRKG